MNKGTYHLISHKHFLEKPATNISRNRNAGSNEKSLNTSRKSRSSSRINFTARASKSHASINNRKKR